MSDFIAREDEAGQIELYDALEETDEPVAIIPCSCSKYDVLKLLQHDLAFNISVEPFEGKRQPVDPG